MKAFATAVAVVLLLGLARTSAASERLLFETLNTGCGLRCSECKTGPSCTSGKPKKHCCWNPTGPKPKDGTCSDSQFDENNCGACGTKCGPAQTCCNGVCRNLNTDDANCGLCFQPCLGDTKCQAGVCVAGCPPGQTKCGNECKVLATDPSNCGTCGNECTAIQACQAGTCVNLFTTDLTWVTTNGGNLNGNPWVITQAGTTIRYNVEKSANCDGANGNTQVGTATATITVGPVPALFSFELSGEGELYQPDYDEMKLKFDGQQVGFAHAPGGGIQCQDGPVVFALQTTLPISMAANSVHTFELSFSTNDPLFHVNSFYQLDLSFAPNV